MRPHIATSLQLLLVLLLVLGTAAAFVVRPPLTTPGARSSRLTRKLQQQHYRPRTAAIRIGARRGGGGGDEDGDDDLERLMNRLLTGRDERVEVREWEERRRLQVQQEEEQGLWGKVRGLGRRVAANLPILLFAPLVLMAAVQLSGLAVATAVIAALVVASFSLPVVALAFVVPIAIFLLLGTVAVPIVPFAVFTLAPSLVVAPLFLFLGWLLLQLVTGPTVIREDSLMNSFGGFWVPLDDEEADGVGRNGGASSMSPGERERERRRRRQGDDVIDVKAEEDKEAMEAEEQLRRFDERLRGGRNGDGDEGRRW